MVTLALLLTASFAVPHLSASPWADAAGLALQLWIIPIGVLALFSRLRG